jgi:hypothetical protein
MLRSVVEQLALEAQCAGGQCCQDPPPAGLAPVLVVQVGAAADVRVPDKAI